MLIQFEKLYENEHSALLLPIYLEFEKNDSLFENDLLIWEGFKSSIQTILWYAIKSGNFKAFNSTFSNEYINGTLSIQKLFCYQNPLNPQLENFENINLLNYFEHYVFPRQVEHFILVQFQNFSNTILSLFKNNRNKQFNNEYLKLSANSIHFFSNFQKLIGRSITQLGNIELDAVLPTKKNTIDLLIKKEELDLLFLKLTKIGIIEDDNLDNKQSSFFHCKNSSEKQTNNSLETIQPIKTNLNNNQLAYFIWKIKNSILSPKHYGKFWPLFDSIFLNIKGESPKNLSKALDNVLNNKNKGKPQKLGEEMDVIFASFVQKNP